MVSSPPPHRARQGAIAHAWAKLFGSQDPIERQLAAAAKEGATLARIAHACAFLMLLLFSAGSLVALAGDAVQQIATGHVTVTASISAGVSALLVACMDCGMLYAASTLRLLAARRAAKGEGRLHTWVLGTVAVLEAATYVYMSWRYEAPRDIAAWALIVARALAAPLLSVYLSLARPLPVTARDMLALVERITGEGVLRDLARLSSDPRASLADKVALYLASAILTGTDHARLDALLDVAQRRIALPTAHTVEATIAEAEQPDDTPPTGPGSPSKAPVRNPTEEPPAILRLPTQQKRRRAAAQAGARGANRRHVRTGANTLTESVEQKARAHWRAGMSVGELQRAAGISRNAAGKYRRTFLAEAEAAEGQAQAQEHTQANAEIAANLAVQ
jgi:hypothetical protein